MTDHKADHDYWRERAIAAELRLASYGANVEIAAKAMWDYEQKVAHDWHVKEDGSTDPIVAWEDAEENERAAALECARIGLEAALRGTTE